VSGGFNLFCFLLLLVLSWMTRILSLVASVTVEHGVQIPTLTCSAGLFVEADGWWSMARGREPRAFFIYCCWPMLPIR
jgi:hypothetical protein